MKVVVLAGGMGTRIGEETRLKPKPMITIGNKPILWHIMKTYAAYGFTEFIVCCGYKGNMIKEYFMNYYTYQSNSTYSLKDDKISTIKSLVEPWKVTLANTGLKTLTAGRILQIKEYVKEEPFFLTYGDGVGNVNIEELVRYHEKKGKICTITVTKPEGRFGAVQLDDNTELVNGFKEKAREDQGWINAGFMVCNPEVFDFLGSGDQMLEDAPFEQLAREKKMAAYKHDGFWSPMDTVRDKEYLEKLWNAEKAPWKV